MIFFSFAAEETLLPETFRYAGQNRFVYATHIRHWDCEFAENLHHTQQRNDLSDQTRNKLLYENAKARYAV